MSVFNMNPTPSPDRQHPLTPSRILHPRMKDTLEEANLMMSVGINTNILLVCGPTGVGKTELGELLVRQAHAKEPTSPETEHGTVPAIFIEAPASGERDFSWREFYTRINHAVEGDIDLPRTAIGIDPSRNCVIRPATPQSSRLVALRTAAERALRHRGTRFVVVDEAAHLFQQSRHSQLENQLNTLKSLSNECGVQWILLGSYDLFQLVRLSGQLARRSHVLHFSRYHASDPADVVAFRACLKELAGDMSALREIDVLKYAEVFMENTLGCIGILATVLIRLNHLVGTHGWSVDTLRRALLTEEQVTQITEEIIEGESRIRSGIERHLTLPSKPRQIRKIA